jgi:peptide/nickel transport system permease protein
MGSSWTLWVSALRRSPACMVGLTLFAGMVGLAVSAPLVTSVDPLRTGGLPLHPPSWRYPMGTDELGRDLWSNVAYGARASLLVGVGATAIATLLGVGIGAVAGYAGGWWDELLMRLAELVHLVPRFLVVMLLVALFGGRLWTLVLLIALTGWPLVARVVRSEILSLREREFALAARALGASAFRVVARHLLPNALPAVVIGIPLAVGRAVLLEAGLSFLGLGDRGVASWGSLLQSAQGYMREAWWLALFPGLALTLTVLSLYLVAEGWHAATTPGLGRMRIAQEPERPARAAVPMVADVSVRTG